MPARIHEKEGKERKGRNQGPEKNVMRIASAKGGIRDTLFIPFPSSFPFLFVSFFFFFSFFSRDDVIARWSAGCYVIRRENRSCGEKGEFAKGEGSFCEWKKRKEKEKEKK